MPVSDTDSTDLMADLPDVMTVDRVADVMHRTPKTVRRWIAAGELECIQPSGSGGMLITKSQFRDFVERHTVRNPRTRAEQPTCGSAPRA